MEVGRFSAGSLVLGCLTEDGWEVQLGEGFLWGLLHSSLAVNSWGVPPCWWRVQKSEGTKEECGR